MKTFRQWLGLPVHLVAGLVTLFAHVFFQRFPQLLFRAGLGCMTHVYMPIIRLRRLIEGSPAWQACDLSIGIQPRNAKEEALALADPTVMKVPCLCGQPSCKFKNGMFVPKTVTSNEVSIDISHIVDAKVEERLQASAEAEHFCQLCNDGRAPYAVCQACFSAARSERGTRPGGEAA